MTYLLYGCFIQADRELPGLRELPSGVHATSSRRLISVRFAAIPSLDNVREIHRTDFASFHISGLGYHFCYGDGYEFLLSVQGDEIIANVATGGTVEDACTYLLGPVIGFALRLQGVVCLHASAINIDGQAVCFCGPPGAGKSTIVAALAQQNLAVIAEDVAALDKRRCAFEVQPGYPRVNLWPDSTATLFGSCEALPAITPNWGKRYMSLDGRFCSTPVPLAGVYILGDRDTEEQIQFRPLRAAEAFIALAANTYTPYLLNENMRIKEFGVLRRLTASVPVRLITPPASFSELHRLCGAVIEDARKLSAQHEAQNV